MSSERIYLFHPNAGLDSSMACWIADVREVISEHADWSGWSLSTWEYDMRCSVSINDATATIKSAVGPCVLLRNVQERVFVELRNALADHTVVLRERAAGPAEILTLLHQAREMHLAFDPMLPRKLVIGLLLLAKLERHQMWGGKNKGYMWARDLPKGRGVDERFADDVPQVVNDLYSHDMLIQKKSQGKNKYALNPIKRKTIYDSLRTRNMPMPLQRILSRDANLASARHLDIVKVH